VKNNTFSIHDECEVLSESISAVTWHELLYGKSFVTSERRRRDLERYLFEVVARVYPVLPYDEYAASIHEDIRAELQKRGMPKPLPDVKIASIAIGLV
jgi:predicted nucleic acid-binding protein